MAGFVPPSNQWSTGQLEAHEHCKLWCFVSHSSSNIKWTSLAQVKWLCSWPFFLFLLCGEYLISLKWACASGLNAKGEETAESLERDENTNEGNTMKWDREQMRVTNIVYSHEKRSPSEITRADITVKVKVKVKVNSWPPTVSLSLLCERERVKSWMDDEGGWKMTQDTFGFFHLFSLSSCFFVSLSLSPSALR